MVVTSRVQEIFDDAKSMQREALDRMAAGDIRAAAEKAWCAIKRATDALILARTGHEPENSMETASGLRQLSSGAIEIRRLWLVGRYYTRQGHLHGDCFYCGLCDPIAATIRRIRQTAGYIQDAERLAGTLR